MIQSQVREKIKQALKARDVVRLLVLRGLLTAFTNELVATNRKPSDELTDDEALAVIKRQSKQRKDSILQFKNGGRNDLALKEENELTILSEYLPEEMSKEDVEKIVLAKKEELNITDKSKIGILMGTIMKELKGKVDGAVVRDAVNNLF